MDLRAAFTRYLFVSLTFIVVLIVLIEISLAWGFVWFLMHPGCSSDHLSLPEQVVEVWLQVREGVQLRAWYSTPYNGVVIISLGGLEGALGDNLPPVQFLVEQGYGALQIDSRACARPAQPVTLGGREAEEVAAALDYLHGRKEVRRVGIIGYSMGGAAALRAAAMYPDIAAVVAEGGFYNLGEDIIEADSEEPIFKRIFLYTIAGMFWLQSGENPWEISPIEALPEISPRPVFLIYGEYEVFSGRAQAQFEAAKEPRSLWVVPGSGHGQNYQLAGKQYEQRVLEFFDQALLR